MWPKLLDMSRDECKRLLRRLELEAYAGIISAFRAQGALTDEKKKMLNDLCNMLSISTERHRAEIRRAVNDEKLATVAEHLAGSNTSAEWAIEGRRLVPLLPRLVPQTVFTIAANQAATMAQAHNMTLPSPSDTSRKEVVSVPTVSSPSKVRPARCPSPGSGVVVLPSGLSIPIKSPSDISDNEIVPPPAKRRRSESAGNAVMNHHHQSALTGALMPSPKPISSYMGSTMPSTSKITTGYVTPGVGLSSGQGSPVKITFTKGSSMPGHQTMTSSQKVIIVSSGSTSYTPTILQRSQSLPASRALSTMSGSIHANKHSVVLTTVAGQHHGMMGPGSSGVHTVHSGKSYATSASIMDHTMASYPHGNPSMQMGRQRPKTITKQKVVKPFSIIGGTGGPQGSIGGPSGITMTTPSQSAAGKKPTIHIKQESAGVKIITQTIGNSGKIVPKPITIQTTSGGSVVMVTCVPSSMMMPGKPIVTNAGSLGTTTRTIYGAGTRYVTTPAGVKPLGSGGNVITVSPRALQTALAKSSGSSTVVVTKASGTGGHLGSGKANVIVVQKSQMLPKTVSIQRSSLSSPEVQKQLLSGTSSLLTRPKISMVTTTASMTTSIMSPTVRFPVPPIQQAGRGPHGGVTMATSMMMTPVVGGQMPQGLPGKGPMTVGIIGGPKGLPDASRAAQVVIRSKTTLSQPGQPTRRRSGSPASSAVPFLEFPSQLTPAGMTTEGERLTRVTVQRRSTSSSPTLSAHSSPGMSSEDSSAGTARIPIKDPQTGQQVPMLFHTVSARQPNKEWIDYDGNPPEQSASSAIKALLEFRSQPQQSPDTVKQRQTSLDLGHMGRVPLNQATKSPNVATINPPSRSISQHISIKKGALTGPLPAPMRPIIQRSSTLPITTSPSVFTGSQSMMFQRKQQGFQDMRRPGPTQFLQSATMEVEKALQEQNKTQQSKELSATLPQLINPPRPQVPKVTAQQQQSLPQTSGKQQFPKKSSIIAIEDQGVVSEQVELSPAEVNSFIDQFERFLESEGLESEMEGSEKLLAVQQAAQQTGLQASNREKAELIKQMTRTGFTPTIKTGLQGTKLVVQSTKPVAKPVEQGASPGGLKAGSGASVAVGQMGSVSGSTVGLSPNQNLSWQDSYSQSLQQPSAGQQKPGVARKLEAQLPSATTTATSQPSSTSPVIITTTTPAVTVESAQKQFSTLHQMLSKAKSTVVEPVVTAVTAVPVKPPATSVVVESSRFDMSQMKMEDFTSQRLQDDFDVSTAKQDDIESPSDSPTPSQKSPARSEGPDLGQTGSGSESQESSADLLVGTRSSKRKRKAPVPIDEDIGPMCMPSWARAALNLLHRVMRFRGANRSKGDLNAASWFTRPVDPTEAPGYMQLIKIPMDFSTIKKKLENNTYNDLSEFHDDMMLVRGNCHKYNPVGHEARKDCEEVFQFYTAEYGKVLDRMQKALQFTTPKSPKKTKEGSSPVPASPTKSPVSSSS